jgi:ABC-type transport system involved in multi-copper enzyme maturation permease subunit
MRFWTVAAATWREAVRQPVSIIVLCLVAILTLVLPLLMEAHPSFDDDASRNMIREVAVAGTLTCGIVIAVFTASAVLADEIESRTVMTLLAKPIRREEVVLGKFLGITMAVALAFLIMIAISMSTVFLGEMKVEKWRANPAITLYRAPWLATGQGSLATALASRDLLSKREGHGLDYMRSAGDVLLLITGQSTSLLARAPGAAPEPTHDDGHGHAGPVEYQPGLASITREMLAFVPAPSTTILLQAFLLTFIHVMVMAAFAIAVSTRLPLVFNALFCAAIFVLGNVWHHMSNELFGTVIHIVPNFQNLELTEALSVGIERIGTDVWVFGVLYGIAYTALVLSVAILLFRRREVA